MNIAYFHRLRPASFPTSSLIGLMLLVGSQKQAHAAEDASEPAFRALYKELVEINTTLSVGSCTQAAEAMAARLQAAGLPAADTQILVPPERPKDGSLIAVLRGRDAKALPILLLAHIDVVEAKREDWQRDPFTLVEENGFFYARGASDDKAMAAVFTDSLIRYQQSGFKPRRSIKLALTCGEETADTYNSVSWLLKTHPEALKAAFALNEGAGGELDANGKPTVLQIQAGEKVYQDFQLTITNTGGHSSRPVRDNAIYRLSAALSRLGAYQFPLALNPVTTAYFEAQSKIVPVEAASAMRAVLANPVDGPATETLWSLNPGWNSMLRTTCVATQVNAGHAPNALPQRAQANVNCRILPGVPVAAVQATLKQIFADDGIAISTVGEDAVIGPPPPLTAAMLEPVKKIAKTLWPTATLVPTMSTGATDSRFLNAAGIPSYGLSGMFHDAEGSHAHGLDERIRVKSLLDGRRFLYEVVKLYAMQPG
ncbi:M20/M25/M40 family metallo-hydrolase [Nevskia ramosa]|uniref:M20/M25/M40 family metallo-hydrolase n=1 Tax=Nevskia ramosa TaxID=64002 RepID=UPI0023574BAC|nr:M20/M25/M40 family metallo-hydrolase [Nevskia ramosa]